VEGRVTHADHPRVHQGAAISRGKAAQDQGSLEDEQDPAEVRRLAPPPLAVEAARDPPSRRGGGVFPRKVRLAYASHFPRRKADAPCRRRGGTLPRVAPFSIRALIERRSEEHTSE